jgi:hypothetical protein
MNLETRLTKLEQSNKRQRIIIACLALMLFASILLSGKQTPLTDVAAQTGRKMELNELTITNRNGDPVIVLRGDAPRNQNPGIILTGNMSAFECFDEADRKTFSLGAAAGDVAYKGELKKFR